MYKKHSPKITLLDLRMPILDGYEAFFNIKKYDPNAKIIFITAFVINSQKIEKAKEMGLLDLVQKPMDFKKIITMIKKHFRSN
jgi:CheY-like chemotaxis protein